MNMFPLTYPIRIILLVVVGVLTYVFYIVYDLLKTSLLEKIKNIAHLPSNHPKIAKKPLILWIVFFATIIFWIAGSVIVTLAPIAPIKVSKNEIAININVPTIVTAITNYEPSGYSKHSSIVRDSKGKITAFIRNSNGDLGFITSIDNGKNWSLPIIFNRISPAGGQEVSAAIDSTDRIHIVWGKAPDASDLHYGVIEDNKLLNNDVLAYGTYARDISVDSANHPHIVWSNIDIFQIAYTGQKWEDPQDILEAGWHPDIQINPTDDIFVFANTGDFYPSQDVKVFEVNNLGNHWNEPALRSDSKFWSGGAAATIDDSGNIYLTWIASTTLSGGKDQVFFSMNIGGNWSNPIFVGDVNTSAGSTGAESPAIGIDKNNVVYILWRGLNEKNRPVIFSRAFVAPSAKLDNITSGWSKTLTIDDRNASDVWWPSVGNTTYLNRGVGIDVIYKAQIGTNIATDYTHIAFP
jgi:hypothetical protein